MNPSTLLIADSGSTKTDWRIIQHGKETHAITTKGMNPFFQTPSEMETELRSSLLPHLPVPLFDAIYFYGAGCTPEKSQVVAQTLQQCIKVKDCIEVHSDLLAAARGLCGHQPGIACILGTGSNSCFFDGTAITANVPALGFILGDEGSGANLGKRLVGDLLKNQLGDELKNKFFCQFNTSMAEVIDKVYRQPFPSRYLASLNVFLEQNRTHEGIHRLLVRAFQDFIERNVMQYSYQKYAMNCIGTIAVVYQPELAEAADKCGVKLGKICKSPTEGLIQYHTETH